MARYRIILTKKRKKYKIKIKFIKGDKKEKRSAIKKVSKTVIDPMQGRPP